jgi:phosphohistidine swiveling domain-containing protein
VGGKAASLFDLLARGFKVPPFFVLTTSAYREAVDGRVPARMRAAIVESWRALGGERHGVAVRSSGVAEDSADFSFAGIFETVLEVTGEDSLIAAIERCWESHRSQVADAYRTRRKVTDDTAMAVIVQRMVQADWAGVSFSADPVAQALSVSVINSTRGLGEKLVSGAIDPEQVRIDNRTGAVVDHHVPDGQPTLPEALRQSIWRETRRAEEAFGFPQDLEWAVEGTSLYLLQSRPISTITGVYCNRPLEPWLGQGTPDAPDRVWTRAYADEVWAPPLTPLFYDIQNLTLVTGQQICNAGDRAPLPPDVFKYYRAAAYMDSAVLARLYATLPPVARRPPLESLLAPEHRESMRRAPWNWRGTLRRLWLFEVGKGRGFGLTRNHRFLAAAWPKFLQDAEPLCDTDLTTLSDQELDDYLMKVWQLALSVAPQCEVAVLYYAHDLKLLLSGLLDRWCGEGERRYAEVSAGLAQSETVRETDRIWVIADRVRNAGERVVEAALAHPWSEFRNLARDLGVADVVERFESFLRQHRHRGANYKDLIYPRWGDDPELLWNHVRAFLGSHSARPSEINARGAQTRVRAQADALAAVRGASAALKRAILRRLFRGNEIYAGIRDNHRFYYDHVWWLVRRVYLEKGRRLGNLGLLAAAGDVVFLGRGEIDALRANQLSSSDAEARIRIRKREWEETRLSPPPRFLRRGYVGDEGDIAPQASATRVAGLGASPGQARGKARIVRDVAELSRVADGEILVARQTDPGWTPAFARLGGLVLETGGVLAHGASLCREYGLPCVTAVSGATRDITDGEEIVVDGSNGWVDLLERGSP